jgi:hypothetical protein
LSASEAFLVNTISSGRAAPTNAATLARPPSKPAVASAPSVCMARATLALCSAVVPRIASTTARGFCDVFAESR